MAKGPRSRALSSLPLSSPEMVRAAVRIQKTMKVTKTTAMIEARPPMSSCASKVSCFVP